MAVCNSARIWILWNPKLVCIQNFQMETQVIHCEVQCEPEFFHLFACYGFNNYTQRWDLWHSIIEYSKSSSFPWVVAGDFNTIR